MHKVVLFFLIFSLSPLWVLGDSFFKTRKDDPDKSFFKSQSRGADVKRKQDVEQAELRHKETLADSSLSSMVELEKKEETFSHMNNSQKFKSCTEDCFFLKSEKQETSFLNERKDYEEVFNRVQKDVLSFKESEPEEISLEKPSHFKKARPALYIFVSFSLHKNALKELLLQAKRFGGTLVIRGLKDGSWRETIEALQSESITLDPNLFKEYDITHIPTFVLTEESLVPQNGFKKKFDKVSGLITVSHALRLFKEKGDLKEFAGSFLRRGA